MGLEPINDLDPLPLPVVAPPAAALRPALLRQMTRSVLLVTALACAATSGLFFSGLWLADVNRTLGAVYAGLAVASALAARLPDVWLPRALTASLLGVMLAIVGAALKLDWGMTAPGLAVPGLMVCVLCAAVGWRAGTGLAVVSALSVLAIAGVAPPQAGPAHLPSPAFHLVVHLIAIAAGLASIVAKVARTAPAVTACSASR